MTIQRVHDNRSPTHTDSATPPGAPRTDGPCPKCHCLVLVAVCTRAGCGGSAAVCWGCPDVAEAFTANAGLCPACCKAKEAEIQPHKGAVDRSSRACMGVTGDGQGSAQPGCCSLRETPVQRRSNVRQDEKLAGAREIVKDLSRGYNDAKRAQRAKIAYSLHLLEERGESGVGR